MGNFDRAGAVLDTYSKGKFPATPDVVRTPRSGVTLTHRVALHLVAGLDPTDAALTSPRAKAEPAVNAWLGGPPAAASVVACTVTVTDPFDGTSVTHEVTQADLGLLPIDLLYLLDPDNDRSGKALDDRIEAYVIANHAPRPHAHDRRSTTASGSPTIAGHVPFFELAALVRSLRAVLLRSRPLRATDMTLSGEASDKVDLDVALAPLRVTLPRDLLSDHRDDLTAFRAPLQARLDAEQYAQIATEIEQTIADFVALMEAVEPFDGLQTGTGTVYADRGRIFAALIEVLAAVIARWDGRLAEFDEKITAYDAAPATARRRQVPRAAGRRAADRDGGDRSAAGTAGRLPRRSRQYVGAPRSRRNATRSSRSDRERRR